MDSRIERLCVERGLKMTGQRRVIARVLSESDDHPDVEETSDCGLPRPLQDHQVRNIAVVVFS